MGDTYESAGRRMACLDCGLRVCHRCAHRWVEYGLRERPPHRWEPGAVDTAQLSPGIATP